MAGHCLDKSVEAQLRAIPGNNICCDCDGKLPQWASVSFGIFMCLECSGRHRALGVHISFVRSVSMDSWTDKQIQLMRAGGNDALNQFLAAHGVSRATAIPLKYNSPAALLYKERLLATIEGRPLPTELPKQEAVNTSSLQQGSDPLPGESEADYVARQRRLQAEARERMRAKFGGSTGLSSGGVMQGIGSDASYRPGDANNNESGIAGVSSKAISLLSSSFALLGETVTKATTSENPDQPPPIQAVAAKGWAAAIDLWNKASEATSELVKDLSKPEDEAYRFPRPVSNSNLASSSSAYGSSGISSKYSSESTTNSYGNSNTSSSNSSSGFYRNDGATSRSNEDMPSLSKPTSSWDEDDFDNAGSASARSTGGSRRARPPKPADSQSPISPMKAAPSPDALPPAPQTTAAMRGPSPVLGGAAPNSRGDTPTLVSSRGSSPALPASASSGTQKSSKTVAAPTGDDFFATFGV